MLDGRLPGEANNGTQLEGVSEKAEPEFIARGDTTLPR